MLIFQFAVWSHKKCLFTSYEQLAPMEKIIIQAVRNRFNFLSLANGCAIGQDKEQLRFQMQFDNISAGSDENTAAVIRELTFLLMKLGLKSFFQISVLTDSKNSKYALLMESIIGEQKIYSKLLDSYKIATDSIPEKYLCCISSGEIMDDPVYIKGGNDRYDFNSLKKWYISQEKMYDPVRNVYIEPEDIIHDGALQAEIQSYVTTAIEESLKLQVIQSSKPVLENIIENKAEKISLLMEKYKLKSASEANRETAFRRAAAYGNRDDMEFLSSDDKFDIDAKDNNPDNGKTALHWAVINQKESCVAFLLQKKAKLIKDAKYKTPQDYANEGSNTNIKTMFTCKDRIQQMQEASEKEIETGIKFSIV